MLPLRSPAQPELEAKSDRRDRARVSTTRPADRGDSGVPIGRVSRPAVQQQRHSISRVAHGFVLPHSNNDPTGAAERLVIATVAVSVDSQLGLPPFPVRFREDSVIGAGVPEASVDEHGDTKARERDVDVAPWSTWRLMIDSEPEPSAVEFAPERELRPGVAAAVGSHRRPSCGRGCGRRCRTRGHGAMILQSSRSLSAAGHIVLTSHADSPAASSSDRGSPASG